MYVCHTSSKKLKNISRQNRTNKTIEMFFKKLSKRNKILWATNLVADHELIISPTNVSKAIPTTIEDLVSHLLAMFPLLEKKLRKKKSCYLFHVCIGSFTVFCFFCLQFGPYIFVNFLVSFL